MTVVVFAGPSIADVEPAAFSGVDLRPPAACGDILGAARGGATTIGLIDGLFGSVAAVWHKEILFALDIGVRVIGAASMGALRAAECNRFGMIGVGRIYDEYASARRWSDADVAVLHAPAELGWQPLSEPLVDIDATVDHLSERDLLSGGEASSLRAAARRLHYRARIWSEVIDRACDDKVRRAELETLVTQHAVRQKERDARALLRIAATSTPDGARSSRLMGGPLSMTAFLGALARRSAAMEQSHRT